MKSQHVKKKSIDCIFSNKFSSQNHFSFYQLANRLQFNSKTMRRGEKDSRKNSAVTCNYIDEYSKQTYAKQNKNWLMKWIAQYWVKNRFRHLCAIRTFTTRLSKLHFLLNCEYLTQLRNNWRRQRSRREFEEKKRPSYSYSDVKVAIAIIWHNCVCWMSLDTGAHVWEVSFEYGKWY